MISEWCSANLRDCQAWKAEGFQISTNSNEAARLFDALLRQYVSWTECEQLGGMDKTLSKMIEAEPNAIMSRVISLGLEAIGTGRSIRLDKNYQNELKQLLNDASKYGTIYEKIMRQLFICLLMTCEEWEKILVEIPNDLLALKFAHDAYFYLGDKQSIRNSIARVFPKWKTTMPCYSYLHGMYAFGLEECEQYDEAEKYARTGLELNRYDAWATHALAHCMEMNGRVEEGIRFMETTEMDWNKCSLLACHNYWHTALYYIELGKYDEALSYYDREISERTKNGAMLDFVDASSILLRFEMEGISVGNRWKSLLPLIKLHVNDHTLAFNDAHIRMVIEGCDDAAIRKNHCDSVENFLNNGFNGDNSERTRNLGKPICDAITFYYSGDYHKVVQTLAPIRHNVYGIGGSNAQRDIFTQLLIHSALSSTEMADHELGKTILDERNMIKKNSALGQRLLNKYHHLKGS
ncbi:Tetratricopeptide repeat protein 38 [Dirofilaria immitis]|nr:Tetratricopeptide repeat protein 38 [Dirofilaria immitis]